jgi:hypothetical protein
MTSNQERTSQNNICDYMIVSHVRHKNKLHCNRNESVINKIKSNQLIGEFVFYERKIKATQHNYNL